MSIPLYSSIMPVFTRIKRKISLFLVFIFTICLILLPNLTWVNAQKAPKPKPQDWHVSGIMAALDDGDPKVQGYAFNQLARYEAQDLKAELKKPEDVAQKAAKILKDENVSPSVRGSAASALGNLGDAAKPYVKDILEFLKDKNVESYVRPSAAYALGNTRRLELKEFPLVLYSAYYDGDSSVPYWRWSIP